MLCQCHHGSTVAGHPVDPDTAEASVLDNAAANLNQKRDVFGGWIRAHGTLFQRNSYGNGKATSVASRSFDSEVIGSNTSSCS